MRLDPVKNLLREAIGLNPDSLGDRALARAASLAMSRCQAADPEEFAAAVRERPELLSALVHEVVVPETWFFRDEGPFELARSRLVEMRRRGRRPRLLSAPCSTGEEAYSLAITALEAGYGPNEVAVTAVDVSSEALDRARTGRYGPHSFRENMVGYLRYFTETRDEAGHVERLVDERAARAVRFVRANIVDPDFLAGDGPYDVIFSRNLLIYLTEEARRTLLANMLRLLAPDGLLFAGHSEISFFLAAGLESVRTPRTFACRRPAAASGASGPGPVRKSSTPVAVVPSLPAAACPLSARPGSPEKTRRDRASARPVSTTAGSGSPGRAKPDGVGPRGPNGATADPGPSVAVETPLASIRSNGQTLLNEARRKADRGELAEAGALCRRHLRQEGPSAEAYYLLGLVGAAERRPEEAREAFQKALYLDPGHETCLTHLSLIHEQLGETAKAEACRRRLRRLADDPEEKR